MGRSANDRRQRTAPPQATPAPAKSTPVLALTAEAAVSARTWLILGVILLIGVAIRVMYLNEVRSAPDFAAPLADGLYHDYWARAIVTGNWTPPAGSDDPRIREVPYTRPPGYTWMLATTYWALGSGYMWPRVVQVILGLTTAVLGFMLGRMVFNQRVGLWLAAIICTFWLFVHYEGELQEPALLSALGMGLMVTLCRWCRHPAAVTAIVAGLIAGAFAITRSNILLFVPCAIAWMIWCGRRRGEVRASVQHAAYFALAAAIVVAPVTIRNWRVSGEPVVVACNGPINFYIGNNPDADGYSFTQASLREVTGLPTWGWFSYDRVVRGLEARTGQAMSYGDASRYFNSLAWDYIKANPGRFIELCAKRAILFWGPVEVPNNKVERLERARSPLLRFLPNYSLMLALTLVGLTVLFLPQRRGENTNEGAEPRPAPHRECLTLVGMFVLVYFLSFVPFLTATRFRAPLLPIVFVLAAFALDRLWLSIRARRWSAAGMLAGVVATLTVAFMWIASAVDVDLRDVPRWHTDRGAALANAQRHQDAVREYQQAIDFNDKYVAAYTAWFESALALGEIDQCLAVAERLRAARPDRTDAIGQMAGQVAERGQQALRERRAADAVAWLGASVSLNASQPVALCDLATALSQTNQMEQAVQRYHEALAIKPDFAEAWFNLGVAQHRVNKLTEAADAYRKAIELRPRYIEALINLGQIDAMQGRFDDAQRRLDAALAIDPANAAARQSLEQLNQMRRGGTRP